MSEAWLSSSEMIASSGPNRVSKIPPLASKHDEYRRAASVPRKVARRRSSSVWTVCVPQMNRTEAMPNPHCFRAAVAAAITRGSSASPR